jgi:hypothetical protein
MKVEHIALIMAMLLMGGILLSLSIWPEYSKPYTQGVDSMKKEAFQRGFMTKEIDKDDKVVYRWLEPHKYNEQ